MLTKKIVLLSLASLYTMAGAVLGLAGSAARVAPGVDFAIGIATIASIYVWCRLDSLAGAKPIGRWPLWAAIFPPIALPLYFFRARTAGRALISIAKALAYYIGLCILLFGAAALVAGIRK